MSNGTNRFLPAANRLQSLPCAEAPDCDLDHLFPVHLLSTRVALDTPEGAPRGREEADASTEVSASNRRGGSCRRDARTSHSLERLPLPEDPKVSWACSSEDERIRAEQNESISPREPKLFLRSTRALPSRTVRPAPTRGPASTA